MLPAGHERHEEAEVASKSPILSQIIYDGSTFHSLPPGRAPQWHLPSHGANHVSNSETLLSFTRMVQHLVDADTTGAPGRPWLCLLDCAPSHIAEALLAEAKAQLPRMHLCFVEDGVFSASDLAVMRPWEVCVRGEAAPQWAQSVMERVDPTGLARAAPKLKLNSQDLVIGTTSKIGERP